MSTDLNMARQLVAAGRYKQAVNSLYCALPVAQSGDRAEAQGILDLVADIEQKEPKLRSSCDEIASTVSKLLVTEASLRRKLAQESTKDATVVATFGAGSKRAGKKLVWRQRRFEIAGYGPIENKQVSRHERRGQLEWVDARTTTWAASALASESAAKKGPSDVIALGWPGLVIGVLVWVPVCVMFILPTPSPRLNFLVVGVPPLLLGLLVSGIRSAKARSRWDGYPVPPPCAEEEHE